MNKFYYLFMITLIFSQDTPYFDGHKAYEYLKKQCEFGPRYPGSEGHLKMKRYLNRFFRDFSCDIIIMDENVKHPYTEQDVYLTNYLIRFYPERENRIMIMAHWDTREIADKDPIKENREKPIIGANDGASGISILMVIAEIVNENTLYNIGLDLLFIDGEDMGKPSHSESFGLGTLEFSKRIPKPYPKYAVCLDMVGDAEPEFFYEKFSLIQAPELTYKIWEIASSLGYSEFKPYIGPAVYDDHRVLYLNSGIPAIDIIDFEYPNSDTNYWHTLSDIPKHCSSTTLEKVGNVVITLIYNEDNE